MIFLGVMRPFLALSLVATALAATAPVSFLQIRDAIKTTDKESHVSNFEHGFKKGEKEAALWETSRSFEDTDDSYTQVARLRNENAMKGFIRQLLRAYGKTVTNEGALQGFVPWFAGTHATQNYSQMKEELFKKPWVVDAADHPIMRGPKCAITCYNAKHVDKPWENKCNGKQCSGCQECREKQTRKASDAPSETKLESSLESNLEVQTESEVKEASSNGFGDAVEGPEAHIMLPVDRAQVDETDSTRESEVATNAEATEITPDKNMTIHVLHSSTGAMSVQTVAARNASKIVNFNRIPASPAPVPFITEQDDTEERPGANSPSNEANWKPTETTPSVRHGAPVALPPSPSSAVLPVAATRPGSLETPPVKEELLIGVQSVVGSQSQIVNDIASKIAEIKENAGKAEWGNRNSLDETKAVYQRKLLEQHMNTTRLGDMNNRLEKEINALKSHNIQLRNQAQELKTQSFALREQVMSVESNLTLAHEFAAKALIDDAGDEYQFLKDLRRNESEVAQAHTHSLALDHFGERSSLASLQFDADIGSVELIHAVEHTFSELSAQAKASKVALDQLFEQRFNQETRIQESMLVKQRALLDERHDQLALHSKLADAVSQAVKLKTYMSDRILHLRSYALRLSKQHS